MPNIQSAIKRTRQIEKRRAHNTAIKSAMRTAMKSVEQKLDNNDVEGAKEAFSFATKKLDKAANKNIIHKNTAARHKRRLAQKINAASNE
ncbi:30S ribosomal protein S20 [Pueribacillus sp. YX66]|uniref:30S ribosomal protein S20 n=1 Tax=Pueribacillus sp. YX66 TaxID=3229242 RepID=UPI00358D3687